MSEERISPKGGKAVFAYSGRVYVRPMNRGIVLGNDDQEQLNEAIYEALNLSPASGGDVILEVMAYPVTSESAG